MENARVTSFRFWFVTIVILISFVSAAGTILSTGGYFGRAFDFTYYFGVTFMLSLVVMLVEIWVSQPTAQSRCGWILLYLFCYPFAPILYWNYCVWQTPAPERQEPEEPEAMLHSGDA